MARFIYKARGPYGQVEGVQEAAVHNALMKVRPTT